MTMNFETSFRQHLLYLLRLLRDKAATIFKYTVPKEKTFSALFMLSEDGGKSFGWIMLEDQEEWIAQEVANDIKKAQLITKPFVAQALKFKFCESGLVSYFNGLDCRTDVIRDFTEEEYLIKYGYRLDEKLQSSEFDQLNSDNKEIIDILNNSRKNSIKDPIDAFTYLEGQWAFPNVPFYYFRIYPYGVNTSKNQTPGKISGKIQLLAITPLFTQHNNNLVDDYQSIDRLYYFIDFARSATLGTISLREKIKEDSDKILQYSLRSAISAIMSRNGSHNIGSHVIYNVIKDIDRLNVQDNKYLFKYLQQRMDFVAQISTSWVPEWTSSSWLVKELMKGFFEQAHVLNYIAKSEGLQFDTKQNPEKMRIISKHVFKCKKGKKERKLIVQIELGEDSSSQKEGNEASGGANLDEDVPVAVPGGNIGFHAFYTIVENFIRNAAKHEFSSLPDRFKKQKNLRVNIEIEEDENRKAYTVRVWDNLSYISNVMHDEKADNNPFKVDDKKLQIADNNENHFKNLELKENEIKLIVIEADNQVLTISIKDVQVEDLGTQCDTSETGPYCFVIHTYEEYGNKLLRPRVIPGFYELIKNPNIRFISQPRWEGFLSRFNEKDKTDKRKIEEKLKGLFEDNWLPIHCKINNEFGKDLINEDGSLRRESWGLSEMRISAGYLQKMEILDVGNGKRLKETNFIKAVAIPELVKENKPDVRAYRLGYEFKLLKPKEVLIVGVEAEDGLYAPDKRSLLEKESVFLEKDITNLNDFDYEFIVIVGDEVGKVLEKLMGESKHEFLEKFPYRIILAGNSKTKIIEDDPFLSKRIAICKDEALVANNLSDYLSIAVPTKNATQSKDKKSKESTPLETLKLRVYEKWVEHLKNICRKKSKSEDVHLVVLTQGVDSNEQDKEDEDFTDFLKSLKAEGFQPDERIKDDILAAIREHYGFYNKTHKPETLPEELYNKSGGAAGKSLAYSFNNELEQLSLDSLKDFKGQYHDNTISYLRHGHLCEEMKCEKNCGKVHKPIYDEYLSGGANHFPIVANIPSENDKPYVFRKMLLKLIENGIFKIAIADERCWDYLADRPSLAKELTLCGVCPVKRVLSFNMVSLALEESRKTIEIDQDDDGQIKITDEGEFIPDAIIIHQGILDKIVWKDFGYKDQKQFLTQLKAKIPFLAITSGRGEPSNLPKSAKFMGFSIIEQHILSDPHSKLLLTDSFMKLSRGGEV